MCITPEEIDDRTDDTGAAAVGIVGACITVFGALAVISGVIGGMVGVCVGIVVIGIAAWMVARKM